MSGRFCFLFFLFGIATAGRYDPLPEEALAGGEIDILTWNTTSTAGMQSSALRNGQLKWPNGQVPVHFHSSISSSEKNMIAEAMQEIHQKTCVRFNYAQDHDQAYVLIVKPRAGVCNSFVGRQGAQQQLNLGPGCYHRGVILHELMHALGFIHEHNRADRDQHVTIRWDKVKRENEHDFTKRLAASLTLMDTPYSYDSVMHYEGNLFSRDGSPTIVPKRQVKLGGGDALSPIDVLRINRYYGCQTTEPQKKVDEVQQPTTTHEQSPNWDDWHQQQRRRFQQHMKEWNEKVAEMHRKMKEQMQGQTGQWQQSWSSWTSW